MDINATSIHPANDKSTDSNIFFLNGFGFYNSPLTKH